MQKHSQNETILYYSLVLIRSAGRFEHIPLRPTIPMIVSSMRRFPNATRVLFFGCAVFWQILVRHNNEENDALALISSTGGLECVVTAVSRNKRVVGLGPVSHLILSYAWEFRATESEAATRAFGGTDRIIPFITGVDEADLGAQNDDGDANDG
mmetsp:Transcript_17519/g.28344  ORF Transcript_17519/g.28344 Transcript_17519/m.28344 type:complete len:154 (-) Transcript_17519:1557-2018(-)